MTVWLTIERGLVNLLQRKKTRAFLFGCSWPTLLALLVYTVFFCFGSHFAMSNAAEEMQDAQMSFRANHVKPKPNERHIVLVDFDEQTLSDQGDPALIPIPLVSAVLEQLAASKPWAIFVDLDITYLQAGSQLDQLQDALLELQRQKIPVFLERELLSRSAGHLPHFRTTPLSSLVARSPMIAWFSAASTPSARGVERHIPHLVSGSVGLDGAVTEQVPSAALAALLLQDAGSEPAAKQLLASALANPKRACPDSPASVNPTCFATTPPLVLTKQQELVHYAMRWNKSRSFIQPIPVNKMLAGRDSALAISPNAFAGDVIILGSSAEERGDLRQTALGEMPGSLVIANMIRAWLVDGPEKTPGYLSGFRTVFLLASALAAFNYLVLMRIPEIWHDYASLALSTIVSTVMLAVSHVFALSGGVGWLIALQYVNTLLVRSPKEKPDPLRAWLKRIFWRLRQNRGAHAPKA